MYHKQDILHYTMPSIYVLLTICVLDVITFEVNAHKTICKDKLVMTTIAYFNSIEYDYINQLKICEVLDYITRFEISIEVR